MATNPRLRIQGRHRVSASLALEGETRTIKPQFESTSTGLNVVVELPMSPCLSFEALSSKTGTTNEFYSTSISLSTDECSHRLAALVSELFTAHESMRRFPQRLLLRAHFLNKLMLIVVLSDITMGLRRMRTLLLRLGEGN